MDGNKDDALRSLRIGKKALEAGDRTRALKFIEKARRLDPTLPVDDLLSSIQRESDEKSPAEPPSKSPGQSSVRHRAPSSAPSASSSGSVQYTAEQIAIVREIRKKKDYYEILGVDKSCAVEDVRKAYRKLSLKVHPDKNKAPGAEEAFKSVSKAFQCLGNEENKKKYDLTGSEEPVYERRPARRGAHYNGGFYEAGDVDAEEIFRNFFFGGMPPTTQFRGFNFGSAARQRTADDHSSGGTNFRALVQLLPILLIVLLQFLPSSEPIYALSRAHPYQYRFITPKGVNYYVRTTTFEQEYPYNSPQRATLENSVERDYFNTLAQNCRLELQRKQWGFVRETPHCEMLRNFETPA